VADHIHDGSIALVVGVEEVEDEAAWRLEPLASPNVAIARQEPDPCVLALIPERGEARALTSGRSRFRVPWAGPVARFRRVLAVALLVKALMFISCVEN
jgi:hypothetical protein